MNKLYLILNQVEYIWHFEYAIQKLKLDRKKITDTFKVIDDCLREFDDTLVMELRFFKEFRESYTNFMNCADVLSDALRKLKDDEVVARCAAFDEQFKSFKELFFNLKLVERNGFLYPAPA